MQQTSDIAHYTVNIDNLRYFSSRRHCTWCKLLWQLWTLQLLLSSPPHYLELSVSCLNTHTHTRTGTLYISTDGWNVWENVVLQLQNYGDGYKIVYLLDIDLNITTITYTAVQYHRCGCSNFSDTTIITPCIVQEALLMQRNRASTLSVDIV